MVDTGPKKGEKHDPLTHTKNTDPSGMARAHSDLLVNKLY